MRHFTKTLVLIVLTTGTLMPPSVDVAEETSSTIKGDGCRLPEIDEISSIVADMYCHPFAPLGAPDITTFQIPREKFSEAIHSFQKSISDKEGRESDFSEIGTIRINLKNGSCLRICWFDGGQNRLYFSCAGRRYVRTGNWIGKIGSDETLNVDGQIRQLHRELIDKP